MPPSSFDLRRGGTQGIVAAVVLAICFAAWCVQLGGVASLQASCSNDLGLAINNLDATESFLLAAQANMTQFASAQSSLAQGLAALPTAGQLISQGGASAAQGEAIVLQSLGGVMQVTEQLLASYPQLLQSLATVAHRTTAVFTLTPDDNCSDFYRYQWLNTSLQFVCLCLAMYALSTSALHSCRVALCCMLTVASVLDIENAHTFYYVRQYAPEPSLTRGKVFFVGCIITAASNLLLLFVLGIHNEDAETAPVPATSANEPMGQAYLYHAQDDKKTVEAA